MPRRSEPGRVAAGPVEASNATICKRFLNREVETTDVLKVTSSCIQTAGRKGGLQDIRACIARMDGLKVIKADAAFWKVAILACQAGAKLAKSRDEMDDWIEEAKACFDRAVPLFKDLPKGDDSGLMMCSLLMAVYARAGNAGDALHLLYEEMPALGIMPNVTACNAAISACKEAARQAEADEQKEKWVTAAEQVFGRMVELLRDEDVAREKHIACTALISVYAEVGSADRALEFLNEEMTQLGIPPNTITYNAVLNACKEAIIRARTWEEKERWVKEAEELFNHASKLSEKEDADQKRITCNTLISIHAEVGNAARALEVLNEEMPNRGVSPNIVTYNAMICACKEAVLLAKTQKEKKEWLWEAERGFSNARLFLEDATVGAFDKRLTCNALLSLHAEIGNADRALVLLNTEMPNFGIHPNILTYGFVINACKVAAARASTRQGKEQWAIQAEKVFRLANKLISDPSVAVSNKLVACNGLISAYAEVRNAGRALNLLNVEMPKLGISPNFVTFTAVISACEDAGMSSMSMDVLSKAVTQGIFRSTLGYEVERNVVDFHAAKIYVEPSSGGVSSRLARVLFRYHYDQGHIESRTQFIVGHQGADKVRKVIEQCIEELGYLAEDLEDNPGRLQMRKPV